MVHARSRSRAVTAFVMIGMCIGASVAACADLKRSNGDECIKNEECASLVCESLRCVPQPPLFSGTPTGDDQSDSAPPVDSGTDTGTTGTKDTGPAEDTGTDAPAQDALNDVNEASDDAVAQNDGAQVDGAQIDSAQVDSAQNDGANDANAVVDDGSTSDGSVDALSDASDSAHDADLFDATLDVNLDVNVPDVLGG